MDRPIPLLPPLCSPHRMSNKRLILKSVAPYELRASIGPDVMNVLTGQATEEEEKAETLESVVFSLFVYRRLIILPKENMCVNKNIDI